MNRIALIAAACLAVLLLSAGVYARGLGEERRGQGHGGAGISHIAPSANRPSFNRTPSSGQLHRSMGSGYSKPSAPVQNRSFAPEHSRSLPQVDQGRNRPPTQGMHAHPQNLRDQRPTQSQLQEFLKLPKANSGQQRHDLGKIGAAAVGGAAGAVALDHFLNRGRPGDQNVIGHQPGLGGHIAREVNTRTAQNIRDNYAQHYQNMFNKNWWGQHQNLNHYYWHNHIWPHYPWNYWWRPAAWVALSSWIPWNWGAPFFYDYGANFYYDSGFVYLDGRRLCTAGAYYGQAAQILSGAPEIADDAAQWMPLGVFALSQSDSSTSSMVLQLAVNKDGIIQGTYYNTETDAAKPVKGMVDKQSQRAVWTFADDDSNAVIMETGIYNLTQDQTDVLVHFGKARTEQWLMVRLKEPAPPQ